MTIKQLVRLYQTRKRHPKEVIKKLFEQIKKQNPTYNLYLTLAEKKALVKAEKMNVFDKPLSGVPVAVKDNFCTLNLRTTASANVLDKYFPPYSATVINKLEENGAIVIGKTNMDAWAHGSSTETSDYGPTLNPYDQKRVPGGSSGGSAAAVALGLPNYAIGSETAGSLRQPAAWCGVVGLKPTYGRVSRYGLIAMASSLDSPGPLTKTTEDAALLLKTMAGFDKYDSTTTKAPVENYLKALDHKKTFIIGISDDYFNGVDKKIIKQFNQSCQILKKLGHQFKKVKLIKPEYSISAYTILQRAEVSSNLCRYDGLRFGKSRDAFSQQAKRRMILGAYALSVGYYDKYYLKAQKVRSLIIENFNQTFKLVDLILAPTTPVLAPKLGESTKNPMFGEIMDQLVEASSIAGLPGINLPIGLEQNLPVGMQIIGPQLSEFNIINLAAFFEKETQFYKLKPTQYYEL